MLVIICCFITLLNPSLLGLAFLSEVAFPSYLAINNYRYSACCLNIYLKAHFGKHYFYILFFLDNKEAVIFKAKETLELISDALEELEEVENIHFKWKIRILSEYFESVIFTN